MTRNSAGNGPLSSGLTFTPVVGRDVLTLSYSAGTLNLGFTLESSGPGTFSTWIFYTGGFRSLWSASIPAVAPSVSFNVPIPGVPPLGPLGGLTTLTTATSSCSDWKVVDTGGAAPTSAPLTRPGLD
jgi:hypothetical protein